MDCGSLVSLVEVLWSFPCLTNIPADQYRGVVLVMVSTQAYGTSFVQGGWSLLPEYFFHCLHENQVNLPECYLIFLPKNGYLKNSRGTADGPYMPIMGISVAGCYWWGDGTCCGIGWGWVWFGGAGARGGTRHTWYKPIYRRVSAKRPLGQNLCRLVKKKEGAIHGHLLSIHIIINHKFTRPSSISPLGDFSLSQMDSQFLRNL